MNPMLIKFNIQGREPCIRDFMNKQTERVTMACIQTFTDQFLSNDGRKHYTLHFDISLDDLDLLRSHVYEKSKTLVSILPQN